jgi:hypothetical protein
LLRDTGAFILANLFLRQPALSIISLNLENNSIQPKGLVALFKALRVNESIIELNIGSNIEKGHPNCINKIATLALRNMLFDNKFIQYLNVSGLKICYD